MQKEEEILQYNCFQWFQNDIRPEFGGVLFAVPNGELRHIVVSLRLTSLGVLSGVPDLIFVARGQTYYIELKTPTGRLSEAQKNFHAKLQAEGYKVEIIRTFEDFKEFVMSKLKNN